VSKYGARKTMVDNIKFDSAAEARYYQRLKLLKRAGEIKDFELQTEFILQDEYRTRDGKKRQPIKYKADFVIEHLDGTKEAIDVKGVLTPVYRLKKKMFEYRYPEWKLTEVSA